MSQREIADRAAVSPNTYFLWERGQVEPSIERLRRTLLALEFDFHDLQDVLETVETLPAPEPPVPSDLPEEERILGEIVREILEGFNLLLKLRKGERRGSEIPVGWKILPMSDPASRSRASALSATEGGEVFDRDGGLRPLVPQDPQDAFF